MRRVIGEEGLGEEGLEGGMVEVEAEGWEEVEDAVEEEEGRGIGREGALIVGRRGISPGSVRRGRVTN